MTEQSPVHVEIEPQAVVDMPAVQARMLLTDQKYLNPSESSEAPELKKDTVASFAGRNYTLFEEASKRERKAQQENDISFEERYRKWSDSAINCLNAKANKQKVEALKSILDLKNATVDGADIKRLYDKYLDTTSPSAGIKTFIKDVIDSYTKDNVVDVDGLNKNRQALIWVGKMFGSTSSEMIDQLIQAEIKLQSNPDQCYKSLNEKRNDVTEPERKMMRFIYDETAFKEEQAIERGMLPVEARKKDIQELLKNPDVDKIVISAGTGAGKTTKIPQYIYELLGPDEKVAVTQPRRIAAQDLAKTVAQQMGVELGKEVGYAHGKGREANKDTKLLFTIEKSLLIQLAKDPYLSKYNYVMVDEWHERHKDTDMLVALLQKAQELRKRDGKPPLKLIITSATMNRLDLQRQLGSNTRSLEIDGSAHTIKEKFWEKGNEPLTRDVVSQRAIDAALELTQTRASDRNILIFMPGDALISQTYNELMKLKDKLPPDVVIDKLTGSMTREKQDEVIKVWNMVNNKKVSDGKKHIIICSPIAETSLTIDRVDVISSGLVNIPHVDPETGLYYLTETLHSKYGLRQQRGRTGRESDGVWYYLGTEDEYNKLPDRHDPEITCTDLSNELLLLKQMGYTIDELPLVDKDKLKQKNIERARRRLKELGAFDKDENITEIGRKMLEIPQDVHFSRMLVEAEKRKCVKDAAKIVVVCNQTDLFERLEKKDRNRPAQALNAFAAGTTNSDFLVRLRMFTEFQQQGKGEKDEAKREEMRKAWAAKHYFRYETLQRIEDEFSDLLDRLDYEETGTETTDEAALIQCIYEGFKDCLFMKRGSTLSKGVKVPIYSLKDEPKVTNEEIDQDSMLSRDAQYFVSAGGNVRLPNYAKINQAVDPAWLTH